MNKIIIYLFLSIISINSLYAKQKNKKYDKKFIAQYCDLKKNLNVAIVEVNDKAGIQETQKSRKKGYYNFTGKNVLVSPGDASLAAGYCNVGEASVGKEISDEDLECILVELNRKNLNYGIITNPVESGWQRGSMQLLDDIERVNRKLIKLDEKIIGYRKFSLPVTRTLFEDLIYTQIVNALVNSAQFTVVDRANIDKVLNELRTQHSGIIDDSNQKDLGKMLGTDLIAIADIVSYNESTKKKEELFGSQRYCKAKIEVIITLSNVETGVLFQTFNISARNDMKGDWSKAPKSRAVCLGKFSNKLKDELEKSMSKFPFESIAKITKRGSIYVSAGSIDGIKNDMIFDLFISEYDEDEDEYYEDKIGQIVVTDNEKGRGIKAGTKSKCDALDFTESLDRDEEYLIRIPKEIKPKMKCN